MFIYALLSASFLFPCPPSSPFSSLSHSRHTSPTTMSSETTPTPTSDAPTNTVPQISSPSHPVDLNAGGEDGHGTITLRALISTKEAGIIIGKAGETVAKLRDQTKVKAGVSKVVSGVQDRVLSITGSVEQIAEVSSLLSSSRTRLTLLLGLRRSRSTPPQHPARRSHSPPQQRLLLPPSLDLPQPHGHHHRSSRSENQADSRCFGRKDGRVKGNVAAVDGTGCRGAGQRRSDQACIEGDRHLCLGRLGTRAGNRTVPPRCGG